MTEIVKMPDRGHALTIDAGWREVTEKALEFIWDGSRNGAGPKPLDEWAFTIRSAVDETRSWTGDEFSGPLASERRGPPRLQAEYGNAQP